MGIKDLHKFISEKFSEVPEAVPVSSFKGYRIAVDVYGLGYILMASIRSRYIWSRDVIANPLDMSEMELPWLKAYFDYFLPWLKAGITPVFVFDGPHKAIKSQKMEKDRAEKEAKKAELEGIMQTAKGDAWKTNPEMLDRARKLLVSLTYIPPAQIETLKNIMQSMKFPVVQAPGDGETVCSALCKAGYVAAVFSADGDNLAHGCPVLIRDKADVLSRNVAGMMMEEDAFSIVRMSKLLDAMNLTQAQFTDFCIMCGCDYNERIFNVGPVKSLDKIRTYRCIENVPMDTRILNHLVCRQEFTTVVDLKALEIDEPGALDVKGWDSVSSECMASYNLETLISDYRTYIQRLPSPRDFHHPPSLARIVVGDFDQLQGVVPLPKQEKKSKYAKKSRNKKKEKEGTDWSTVPLFNVPGATPGWSLGGPPVQSSPYQQSLIYPVSYAEAKNTRFVMEDDEPSPPLGIKYTGPSTSTFSPGQMYAPPVPSSGQMYALPVPSSGSFSSGQTYAPPVPSSGQKYAPPGSFSSGQMYALSIPSSGSNNSSAYVHYSSFNPSAINFGNQPYAPPDQVPSTPHTLVNPQSGSNAVVRPLDFPQFTHTYSAQTPNVNTLSAQTPYQQSSFPQF